VPTLDEAKIAEIVERVVSRLAKPASGGPAAAAPQAGGHLAREHGKPIPQHGGRGSFPDPESAIRAATAAFEENEKTSLELRGKMIAAMRDTTRAHLRELAELAVAETGLGRVEDKLKKNTLVIEKTPGTEILAPRAMTGDYGLTLIERAPYGVIGAVTPCTNPTETILCNGIGMVAGGNSIAFNVHPLAAKVCAYHIHLLNEAIRGVGGPDNLLTCVTEPTIESAQTLMKHPGIRLLVVTGGPGVVQAALAAKKKVIAAGPGNPPAVVDETARLDIAARGIVEGGSIDNNILCTAEKEIVAVGSIADRLKQELAKAGAHIMSEHQARQVERLILTDGGKGTNKDWVGKDAAVIARAAGISVDPSVRLLVTEADEQHPFVQHELLMPVLGLVRVKDVADGIAAAKRIEHGFCHTAVMYSTNIEAMSAMARVINTSIFVKNGPNLNGLGYRGEGYTSFTIASPTGEGLTTALNFTRERRCTLKDSFRFV
jgi:acyl-CoA reductase-like NAD-dependent aldehyde dehydrogenase